MIWRELSRIEIKSMRAASWLTWKFQIGRSGQGNEQLQFPIIDGAFFNIHFNGTDRPASGGLLWHHRKSTIYVLRMFWVLTYILMFHRSLYVILRRSKYECRSRVTMYVWVWDFHCFEASSSVANCGLCTYVSFFLYDSLKSRPFQSTFWYFTCHILTFFWPHWTNEIPDKIFTCYIFVKPIH